MEKEISAFETCREMCGACKSECLENNVCDLITVCDLCMMACTMKIISLRRPSHCQKETCKKVTSLCKDLIKKCHDQCLQYGHAGCVKACKAALSYC